MNIREPLISQFIDDELSLPEKRVFLEELARDPNFSEEALELVEQEILITSDPMFCEDAPAEAPPAALLRFPRRGTLALSLAAAMLIASLVVLFLASVQTNQDFGPGLVAHRFVLYQPDAQAVEISGSFNNWTPVAMHPAGKSGYWEAVLRLPPGEHRFSYLIGPGGRVPDPTLLARENDGFGGENSILTVEEQA